MGGGAQTVEEPKAAKEVQTVTGAETVEEVEGKEKRILAKEEQMILDMEEETESEEGDEVIFGD